MSTSIPSSRIRRLSFALAVIAVLSPGGMSAQVAPAPSPAQQLAALIAEAAQVRTPTRAASEYAAASAACGRILQRLRAIDRAALGRDDQVDYDLLDAHVMTIPDFDYAAVLATPMARRTLSFGGAQYGPTVAGRLSGYYVLTPLEPWLTEAE